MTYVRWTTVLLALAGLLGALSPAPAHAVCRSATVPTGVDYPVPDPLRPLDPKTNPTTCRHDDPNDPDDVSNFYDPYTTVPNDYAILYFDAQDPACRAGARDRLLQKLGNNLDYALNGGKVCDPRRDTAGQLPTTNPFQAHLAGGTLAAIYATAVTLLDAGYAVDDNLLVGVMNQHLGIPSPQDPSCGPISIASGGVNSCMDDYSLTAAGYAWIAAYERKRGRFTSAQTWAGRSKGEITKSLSHWNQTGSICFYPKGTVPGRCDATRADVEANRANVIGADHNQENPAYGFGLMTSIATACEGLERAAAPCSITGDARWTAQQLLLHAQQRTYFDTAAGDFRFTPWCRNFRTGGSIGCWDPTFGPSYLPGYLPTLFPLKRFYDALGLTPDPLTTVVHNGWGNHPAYQFHEYREPRFRWSRDEFWGPLRKLFYQELSFTTWPDHTPQAFTYWIQPAELAGFGDPGSLTVAGGSTESGGAYPVRMYWRNLTTSSPWTLVGYQATPDPNGNPKDTWYNSVPAPTNAFDRYQVAVQHSGGPWHYCTYEGGNAISWCTTSAATPAWP